MLPGCSASKDSPEKILGRIPATRQIKTEEHSTNAAEAPKYKIPKRAMGARRMITDHLAPASDRVDCKTLFIFFVDLDTIFIKWPRDRNHNSAEKAELDGFRRKAARRVEPRVGRNQIGLPPWRTKEKTCSKKVFTE
jgi:hypothetical protein